MFPRRYFSPRYWARRFFPGGTAALPEATAAPGAAFRRRGPLSRAFRRIGPLARLFRRPGATVTRAFTRRGPLARSFRGHDRMSSSIGYDTRVKDASEVVAFVFDFGRFPEAVGGETLSSPVIDASSPAGLTLGSPAVTTADEVVDEHGTTVAAGKGLKVTASGGTAGTTYALEARCTFSGGSVRVVKGAVKVE